MLFPEDYDYEEDSDFNSFLRDVDYNPQIAEELLDRLLGYKMKITQLKPGQSGHIYSWGIYHENGHYYVAKDDELHARSHGTRNNEIKNIDGKLYLMSTEHRDRWSQLPTKLYYGGWGYREVKISNCIEVYLYGAN